MSTAPAAPTWAMSDSSDGSDSSDSSVVVDSGTATFVLPWDLHPCVKPTSVSATLAAYIRAQIIDLDLYHSLKRDGILGWADAIAWQFSSDGSAWTPFDEATNQYLERCFVSGAPTAVIRFGDHDSRAAVDFAALTLKADRKDAMIQVARQCVGVTMPARLPPGHSTVYHAVSYALWGASEFHHVLLDALLAALSQPKNCIARWLTCKLPGAVSAEDWRAEMSAPANSAFALFALANLLQRPLILYGTGPGAGLYLPLLWRAPGTGLYPWADEARGGPNESPLLLTTMNRASDTAFTALVTFRNPTGPMHIHTPLVDKMGKPLPLHFVNAGERAEFLCPRAMVLASLPASCCTGQPPHPMGIATVTQFLSQMPPSMLLLAEQFESSFRESSSVKRKREAADTARRRVVGERDDDSSSAPSPSPGPSLPSPSRAMLVSPVRVVPAGAQTPSPDRSISPAMGGLAIDSSSGFSPVLTGSVPAPLSGRAPAVALAVTPPMRLSVQSPHHSHLLMVVVKQASKTHTCSICGHAVTQGYACGACAFLACCACLDVPSLPTAHAATGPAAFGSPDGSLAPKRITASVSPKPARDLLRDEAAVVETANSTQAGLVQAAIQIQLELAAAVEASDEADSDHSSHSADSSASATDSVLAADDADTSSRAERRNLPRMSRAFSAGRNRRRGPRFKVGPKILDAATLMAGAADAS